MGEEKQIAAKADKPGKLAAVVMPALFVLSILLFYMPVPEGLSQAGQRVLVIAIVAIGLWGTELLPMGVTGMLVVVSLQLSGGVSGFQEALIGFAKPVPYFLIGVLTIGLAVSRSGLAERSARYFLTR